MQIGSTLPKKVPRLLLATQEDLPGGIAGVMVVWGDRSESIVFDLSLSGMTLSPHPELSKVKIGQSLEISLRIQEIEDPIKIKARLVRSRPQYVGLLFESMTSEGRLKLHQATKDRLIVDSLRTISQTALDASLQGDLWLHGAFDTNLILTPNRETGALERVLIEYENLFWIWDRGELLLQKSSGAADDSQPYFVPRESFSPGAKVSMGASWLDRLIKCIQKINDKRGDLSSLIELLRSQRDH